MRDLIGKIAAAVLRWACKTGLPAGDLPGITDEHLMALAKERAAAACTFGKCIICVWPSESVVKLDVEFEYDDGKSGSMEIMKEEP